MTNKVFEYKSGQETASEYSNLLETGEKDGIRHAWGGSTSYGQAHFSWKFDWEDLKNQGVDRLVGHLIVNSDDGYWDSHRFEIDWTETNQSISVTSLGRDHADHLVTFEYNLTAQYAELPPPEKISYDEMFVASDITDMVLVIEGKKLNVNKTFLSIHSDYFSSLFSSNFKERQMHEIEIKEVSYEDFGLLLSSFYPKQKFPNDLTVEKLLEMASRFQVPSVIEIVEHHLLHISKIGYEKMMWLADEYMMPTLLEKCIRQMNSLEMAKKLEESPEFEKLSDRTKALVLGRLLKAI
ncbi:hypothetical protein B9Z55_006902 [Caenorhabditis nigoni]|uniref:BTB domain-containing protein n=1 Tax=Caenorhabditis nigoni TaxID=1611254 RepID=A0A2G5V757_9PELO|nr:hypothetical protein B9Z55_006902 [Caenorhabditis nigoni]